ncbi:Rieske 2Fe-2S domain-containing protein [bacterium]|nr:Rieske 2Fe-2S domain-containing protein [bacterium]
MLQHWHPLCPARRVRRKPLEIQLAGQSLVVFRTKSGDVGVLDNVCPHRRMKLSCGHVTEDAVVCPYHGWAFDCEGNGTSPGTPRLHCTTTAFEVVEKHGFVWARLKNSLTEFPVLDEPGFTVVRPVEQRIQAPLELVLDNFTEVEHAATVHRFIGYSLGGMHRVTSIVAASADRVSGDNRGPQKPVPAIVRWMFGIPKGAEFHWEWITRFSPVHTRYDEFWTSQDSDQPLGVRGRIYAFFVPIDTTSTRLVIFAAFRLPWAGWFNQICLTFREIARQMVRFEIRQDMRMIEQLADTRTEMEGMKLSRFDRTLGLHRERISRVYRNAAQTDSEASVFRVEASVRLNHREQVRHEDP